MRRAAGNGSLMRTLPVALAYADPDTLLTQSARLSAMTHWDPRAEVCCAIYCLWIRELLVGAEIGVAWETALAAARWQCTGGKRAPDTCGSSPLPDDFWGRFAGVADKRYEALQESGFAGYCVECLEAAAWCCLHAEDAEMAVLDAVNMAGEADTIAALAGGCRRPLGCREPPETLAGEAPSARPYRRSRPSPRTPATGIDFRVGSEAMAKILLVDDSQFQRRFQRRALQSAGYDILEAGDGEQAFEVIAAERPDCVLIDLIMPGATGLCLLEELRQRHAAIPVIVVTADIQEQVRQQCLELGAFAVVHKPVDEGALRRQVAAALGPTVEET